MQTFDKVAVAAALPYDELITTLDTAFAADVTVPQRVHHAIPQSKGGDASLLLMPAWRSGGKVGVKIVSVYPDNAKRGLGSVNALYTLMDGETGVPEAVIDGDELTLRRTACASALASRRLSRADSTSLLMVGNGRLAPHLIAAHAAVRPLERIRIWGRDFGRAKRLAGELDGRYADIAAVANLPDAVSEADIVSCATLAGAPLVHGRDLRPGQHIDLVGAFTPEMAEADPEALRRARIFVDTYEGARAEAGDILQAIAAGTITDADIVADLGQLARGADGRRSDEEITLFKSVGTALEDLAAAELVLARAAGSRANR